MPYHGIAEFQGLRVMIVNRNESLKKLSYYLVNTVSCEEITPSFMRPARATTAKRNSVLFSIYLWMKARYAPSFLEILLFNI